MRTNTHLGCRSRLVLEKLGFDLRPYLEETLRAPLPDRLQKLADELGGYAEWRDLGPPPEPAPPPQPRRMAEEDRRWALPYEEPLA